MSKSEKGVTLVALLVTIIVMLIIAGVTVATSSIIDKVQTQQAVANMLLIQTKVKIIMEKASFAGTTEGYYVGIPQESGLYEYDEATLRDMDLGTIKPNGEKYLVNYATGDITYQKGDKVFSLSDMI